MKKPVLIIENSTSSLVKESSNTINDYVLSGPFTEFGVRNRNDRVYTADRFLPALQELNERIENLGVVYGEFDHPDVFDTSLKKASHIVTKAKYIPESNMIKGEIKLLKTTWGKEARSLVDEGLPIFVSSRAAGITESDGSVTLKKLFTYDIVADPGFASAKMDVTPLNESLGYGIDNNTNFRIYEMSDESKINELFNMNKNDLVTKQQLSDYSKYLVNEIASTKRDVKKAISQGDMTPRKLQELLEYYDELNETNHHVIKYLDYLSTNIQYVINENKSLRTTTEKLIKHSDYLAESLEKSINYVEYVAENVDKNISYTEYVAENVDKNIAYTEYVAENVDKNIAYAEYIAENVDKNIAYAEYIAENVDKNIAYAEYIAESLDKNIAYAEYIAESVDNSIQYSEYLAEHVDGNIAYAEYIAENLDDNIAYSEYIAESLDKSIEYQGLITEKLNGNKLFESTHGEEPFPTLDEVGFEDIEDEEVYDEEDDIMDDIIDADNSYKRKLAQDVYTMEVEENTDDDEEVYNVDVEENCDDCDDEFTGDTDTELSESINKLIEEAKKRKVSETSDMNFLKFLNKSQVDDFYALTEEQQEAVKLHINERSYFGQKDVLALISEVLSSEEESLTERVLRLMPENIKPIWEQLDNTSKRSIESQVRLYPEEILQTAEQIDDFWNTRNLKTNESITKTLVSHEALIQEDRISDNEAQMILERFKNL